MQEEIKYITKVEINKLWGYEDLNFIWNLNPDVNILAGDNGSGKSTVLNLIIGILKKQTEKFISLVDSVNIAFDNKQTFFWATVSDKITNLKKLKDSFTDASSSNELLWDLHRQIEDALQEINKRSEDVKTVDTVNFSIALHPKNTVFKLDVINTFEQPLKESESIQKLSNSEIKTELDFQIFNLQKKYLDYQITIGNRAIEILQKGENNILKVSAKKTLFLDTIDALFRHTQKKIDRTKNEVSFIQRGEKEISPYQLSSGEKQMLIILLTALVQDEKHFIMIMDEPEISLHPDWQENLIDNIRKLNANVQIIIATHSPSIVINGWKDKVFEMSEIQTKN